ncbi:MAG: hypothetical protein V8S34_00205 [Lawsonibacter sp.]
MTGSRLILHLLNFAILAGGLYFLLYHPVRKNFMARGGRSYYPAQMENEAQQSARDRAREDRRRNI